MCREENTGIQMYYKLHLIEVTKPSRSCWLMEAQEGFYGNALQAAAGRGSVSVTKVLLEKAAEIDARRGREYGVHQKPR